MCMHAKVQTQCQPNQLATWLHKHTKRQTPATPQPNPTPTPHTQVYKAVLRDTGEEVAVKVQRPGIEPVILRDLFIFRAMGSLFNTISRQVHIRKAVCVGQGVCVYTEFKHGSAAVQMSGCVCEQWLGWLACRVDSPPAAQLQRILDALLCCSSPALVLRTHTLFSPFHTTHTNTTLTLTLQNTLTAPWLQCRVDC